MKSDSNKHSSGLKLRNRKFWLSSIIESIDYAKTRVAEMAENSRLLGTIELVVIKRVCHLPWNLNFKI